MKKMASKKIIGLILFGVGILLFILSYPSLRSLMGINFINFGDIYFMIGGVALIFLGAYMGFGGSSSSKQPEEVPIYEGEGKKRIIVGYKRHKK
jgi:protein-S-isoprenylcysteine O-methyltransferase Ste14